MPERDLILEKARDLEGHVWALEPEGERARWTGKAHGATFELTKPEGSMSEHTPDISHFLLTLKGKIEGKNLLKKDFVLAFGEPETEVPAKRFRNSHTLIWNSAKVLNSKQLK